MLDNGTTVNSTMQFSLRLLFRKVLRKALHCFLIGLLIYSPISAASVCLMQGEDKFDPAIEDAHCDEGQLNEYSHQQPNPQAPTSHHLDNSQSDCDCQCSFCTHSGMALFLDFSVSKYSPVKGVNPDSTKLPMVYLAMYYPPPIL